MPDWYTDWKAAVAEQFQILGLLKGEPIQGNLKLLARFGSDHMDLQLVPVDRIRPPHVRADVDNLVGGIMDAMQDAALIVNDAQIVGIEQTLSEE
jgi:Holliday junction resolvase RusA-like endonuclease